MLHQATSCPYHAPHTHTTTMSHSYSLTSRIHVLHHIHIPPHHVILYIIHTAPISHKNYMLHPYHATSLSCHISIHLYHTTSWTSRPCHSISHPCNDTSLSCHLTLGFPEILGGGGSGLLLIRKKIVSGSDLPRL